MIGRCFGALTLYFCFDVDFLWLLARSFFFLAGLHPACSFCVFLLAAALCPMHWHWPASFVLRTSSQLTSQTGTTQPRALVKITFVDYRQHPRHQKYSWF
jgi:hypothetical protein